MKRLALLPLALGLAACAGLPSARARDALDALQERIIQVDQSVTPSVVHIEAIVRQNGRRQMVTGSGFLTAPEGVVLTNEHVVARAEKVSIIVPDRTGRYPATVVGTDKQTDLAVLRIEPRKGEPSFSVVRLGDSDALRVGEWVIAIGNPYGLDGTVSLGIVSAKGRDLGAEDLLNEFIQTDAMIDRGSSGGPLVNLEGEVVGINSRGQGRGIGFTIPINTARRVSSDLLEGGQIHRGYLGVSVQPLDHELASYWGIPDVEGVIVNGVTPGSPAEETGMQAGDIITRFNGEPVRADKDEDIGRFQRQVAHLPVGQKVKVEYLRKGETQIAEVRLAQQPKVVPDEEETDYGFTVQEVTEQLVRRHRLDGRRGVLVSFVERGSEGAEAGLSTGDVLEHINDVPVADIEAFRAAMSGVPGNEPFLIRVRRGADTRFMLVVPREKPAVVGPAASAPEPTSH